MSHEEAFLQAIAESPGDDTHRLVFADWLEDHGRPERAEFIRLQCELARLDEDDERRDELERRERELLDEWGQEWLGPLRKWASATEFRRGFVEVATFGVRRFLDHAEEIFCHSPLQEVKLLRLNHTRDGAELLARCPQMARLRGLDLAGSGAGDARVRTLLASEHLANLTSLNLSEAGLGIQGMEAIVGAGLTRLKHLDLSDNYLGVPVGAFTEGEPPFRLESLDLGSTGQDADDVRRLADWPGAADLRDLRLDNNNLRVTASEALAESPHLARLERLSLKSNRVGVRGMRALASSPHLAGLQALDVGAASIGVGGLRALAESTTWRRLEELRLNNNIIGPDGAERLAGWPGLASVRVLALAWADLGDAGLRALLRSPHLGSLRELNLRANGLTDAGMRELADCPRLPHLRRLRLSDNYGIREAGALALLESAHLPRLRYLHLGGLPRLDRTCLEQLRGRFVVET
jgi:uncharacterized protein (TIGR02996 family)